MKVQLETISDFSKSPLRLLHNPRLNHLFYWHFHPEFELVYIEGASATRHVGDHVSGYHGKDLVMIGSNIPHLNFDYGVRSEYRKEVLHIKTDFRESVLAQYPEFAAVNALFQRSGHGVAFSGNTREEAGRQLKEFYKMEPLPMLMASLRLFAFLAGSSEFELLHPAPYVNPYNLKEQERLRKIHAYIDENYRGKFSLGDIAGHIGLSREAFCRFFKQATGNTFTAFLNQYRISQAKRLLLTGRNVTEVCFDTGFESLSYFTRTFHKVTGENPSVFRNRHKSVQGA